MKFRAIIFDIYKTLLEVGPPPSDAEERWKNLLTTTSNGAVRLTLEQLDAECKKVIAREHALACANGIAYPEIYWPAVTEEALPEILQLPEPARPEFLYQHAQLLRTMSLMPGVSDVLHRLVEADCVLGIASNSQPYTLREIDTAFAPANLSRNIFKPDFSFFSFENGYSKPDPHVFRLLTARLAAHSILPKETLMIGDRLDNDIAPARAAGWQTWHLQKEPAENGGDWTKFLAWIFA